MLRRRSGVLMGPVPATSVPARSRPILISSERQGTLCDGTLHLRLMLSEVPDRSWLESFYRREASKSPFDGVAAGQLPRIKGDRIYWSIREADLMSAWWYLGRCVDRANAACSRFPARTSGARTGHSSSRLDEGDRDIT